MDSVKCTDEWVYCHALWLEYRTVSA